MGKLARWSLPLVSLLAVGLALRSVAPRPSSLGHPRSCVHAQWVDGELRCDEELLERMPAACPAAPEIELGPGDAIDVSMGACRVERMPPEDLAALAQAVDLNTATPEELASLPGIGPALAARIIEGRPYASVDDLLAVKGIGPKRLEAVRPRAITTRSR
jgi:predicted flap endonuclease-1-like 5' DNA nuclease